MCPGGTHQFNELRRPGGAFPQCACVVQFIHPDGARRAGKDYVVGGCKFFVLPLDANQFLIEVSRFIPSGKAETVLNFRACDFTECAIERYRKIVLDICIDRMLVHALV